MIKKLDGNWFFKASDGSEWKKAEVPGCNVLDLMNNGDIDDPLLFDNEKKIQHLFDKNWEYKSEFHISDAELKSDGINLKCDMLDTICDIYINQSQIGRSENCFVGFCSDIKQYLNSGKNEIKIIFHSPVIYVDKMQKQCPAPINSNGRNGVAHIRKPQCHFGWDWGPVLPVSGISSPIYLDFTDIARIDYLKVTQSHFADGSVIVYSEAEIKSFGDYDCNITLISPSGEEYTRSGESTEFKISNPQLWQTRELSQKEKQPLYTVKATLTANGKIIDEKSKRIGLRTLILNREKDEYGQNFQFILNSTPIFIKGANYIPPDSFITRFDTERLNYLLDAVQFSDMNMIRIWGGGYYASDEFLDACDERGILVWQDFQFACQGYPFFRDDFLENVKREIEYNVKRISHHPSLAIWCGNNEIEQMQSAWLHMKKYIDCTESFFRNTLESEIRKYDLSTPYIPGSPCGIGFARGVNSDNVGDTHLWGVWHGLQPMNHYRKRMTRFCSEFGFESLPDIKTIKRFAGAGKHSLDDNILKSHQKCANGNDKIIYYIASRFKLPSEFESYVYLSQVTQLECIADAVEHWRRNKGRCNGAMYWQLNDCWGVSSWSSIDFYGNYKALQYRAKYFNAPLSVSFEDTENYVKIFLLNDFNKEISAEVEYIIFDFESGELKKETKKITVSRLENREIFRLDTSKLKNEFDLKRTGICARLIKNGKALMQKTLLFDCEKNLDLPKSKLKSVITLKENELEINIKADKFARFVRIESTKSTLPTSDNFFDLLPNQSITATMKKDDSLTLKEQAKSIRIYSLCNIKPCKNMLLQQIKSRKVFLSPVNLANAFYHGRIPSDVKVKPN